MKCTKIALATLFAGMMVTAASADSALYEQDFDEIADGTKAKSIVDAGSTWGSGDNDESVVTNAASAGLPAAQGNVLQINTEGDVLTNHLTTAVDISTPENGVYMDSMIKFVPSDELATITADDTLKLALYAYLPDPENVPNHPNPTLVVYHSYLDSGGEYQQVSTDTGFVVNTGALQRVKVTLKQFNGGPYRGCLQPFAFRVEVGGTVVTSVYAYAGSDLLSTYTEALDGETCGEWFLTANLENGSAEQKSTIGSLAFSGTGYVDDINIADVVVTPTTATITFVNWNNESLQSSDWDIGETPEYTNATPTKAADASGIYTFAGWTPAIEDVVSNTTYTATYTSVAPVASVGGSYYATLDEAIAAASNGGTVVLNGDVTASWPTVLEGDSVVIDLAGHTLTANVDVYGELLLTNSVPATGKLAGTVYVNGNDTDTQDVVTHFTLAEDTIVEADYGIILWQADPNYAYDAQIDIYGTVKGCVWVMGNITEGDSVINVYGTVDATDKVDIGIALNGEATVNIFDGALVTSKDPTTESGTGIEVRAGELNVYGGTIVGTGDSYVFNPNGSGTTSYGVGIAVAQHTTAQDINVNVEGGSITGVVAFATANPQQNADGSLVVDISGGEFIGTGANAIAVDSDDERINGFVSGGTFSSVVDDEYCAEGFIPVTEPNSDGLYEVEAGWKVTFESDGVELYTTNVVANATVAYVGEEPTKAEDADYTYSFNEWQLNGAAYDFATGVTSNFTLVADFTATPKQVVSEDYEAGDDIAGEVEGMSAAMATWLNGKKGQQSKAVFEASFDSDGLSLADEFLLNTDPTVATTVAFSISSIAVGDTVDVNVTLTRTEGNAAVTDAINGTLKIKGAATVDAAEYTAIEAANTTGAFDGETSESKQLTTAYKFFKAVIE